MKVLLVLSNILRPEQTSFLAQQRQHCPVMGAGERTRNYHGKTDRGCSQTRRYTDQGSNSGSMIFKAVLDFSESSFPREN